MFESRECRFNLYFSLLISVNAVLIMSFASFTGEANKRGKLTLLVKITIPLIMILGIFG